MMLVTSCQCVLHQPTVITFLNLKQFNPLTVKYCVLYRFLCYFHIFSYTTLPIVVPVHNIKLYGEVKEQLHSFLISALAGGKWLA